MVSYLIKRVGYFGVNYVVDVNLTSEPIRILIGDCKKI